MALFVALVFGVGALHSVGHAGLGHCPDIESSAGADRTGAGHGDFAVDDAAAQNAYLGVSGHPAPCSPSAMACLAVIAAGAWVAAAPVAFAQVGAKLPTRAGAGDRRGPPRLFGLQLARVSVLRT